VIGCNIHFRAHSIWSRYDTGYLTVWSVGSIALLNHLHSITEHDFSELIREVDHVVKNQFSCFGLIVKSAHGCIAVSDQVRSHPVYFVKETDCLSLANHPSLLIAADSTPEISQEALDEYLMSGYVHGGSTLLSSVKQLRAGEILRYSFRDRKPVLERYFRYLPKADAGIQGNKSTQDWINEFDSVLNRAFERALEDIGEAPIWVPLSGGMDSRLVLCKCLELRGGDITAFSYGVSGNHEMRMAKRVARKLGVPWHAVPSDLKNLQALYQSKERQDYARLTDGFNAVPSYLDFEAIRKLKNMGVLPSDAVIINGYSGDFLFGGHIPEKIRQTPTLETLVDALVEKHCSHFTTSDLAQIKQEIAERVRAEVASVLDDVTSEEQLCSAYEYWDWQERQAKAVVNAQRAYEYFRVNWKLPFWDKELMEFWSTVPLDLRAGQKLHLSYLKWFDFKEVFQIPRSRNQVWPPKLMFMPIIGKLIELVFGIQKKNQFYEETFYFGYFRNQLGLFGRQNYRKYWRRVRRPRVVPIAALSALRESNIEIPDRFTIDS